MYIHSLLAVIYVNYMHTLLKIGCQLHHIAWVSTTTLKKQHSSRVYSNIKDCHGNTSKVVMVTLLDTPGVLFLSEVIDTLFLTVYIEYIIFMGIETTGKSVTHNIANTRVVLVNALHATAMESSQGLARLLLLFALLFGVGEL